MVLECCMFSLSLSQTWVKKLYVFVDTLSKMSMKKRRNILKTQSIRMFL